jgi:branched-chain amino acid transport system ATP-binding protein
MALLEVTRVTKRFGRLVAVNRVDVHIEAESIHAIIGPNGAGKTTLFNCMTGLHTPDDGTIVFKGRPLDGIKPYQRAVLGMSRTFQNIRLFPKMTVLENVMLGRHCRTRAGLLRMLFRVGPLAEERAIQARAEEILHFVGLDHRRDAPATTIPFGEQRRLEVARALATDPDLLLLDEPTSGMNPRETEDIDELITKIRALGKTIVLIEHDMSVVMKISDVVTVLNFGEKIAEGAPSMIQKDQRVVEAYLGTED